MAYDLYTGSSTDEQAKVSYLMQLFNYARLNRVNFEVQWEEAASLCWPEYRNSFSFGHVRSPGVKYTQYQVDSSGSIAAHRFMAICDALLTPYNMLWSVVRAGGDNGAYLMQQRDARLWFEQVTKILWHERYKAIANFHGQNQQNWQQLGVFGNMSMLTDQLDTRPGRHPAGLRYMSMSPGEIYLLQNHQGRIDGYIRHFRWTARQAMQRWGEKIIATAPNLLAALEKSDNFTLFNFLEFVIPRTDYDPMKMFSPQGKPWASIYVSVTGYSILEESGYRTFPLSVGRYLQAPEEWYGRGPAQMVLPELKTLNAEKEAFLKQGLLAGDPAYLLPDDGMFDFKATSGNYNYGGVNDQGQELVKIVPTGNIQVTKEMMDESRVIVNDAFLVTLFPMLFNPKNSQRSAREVMEIAIEMGIFMAPLGRQYGEYIGTMIDRELDTLSYLGKLPKVPPVIKEAKGEYQIVYCSPLARALSNQKIVGAMRSVEMGQQIVNVTGDNSVMDVFDFDTMLPEIAREQFVPEHWLASMQKIQGARKARAQAQERENQVKELPGKAAIMKAQAITAKAQTGGNVGGTLSGTPQGGMPQVPGNPPGIPGQPGVNGRPGLPGRPGISTPGG